jgi:hypothetical protein
MEIRHLLNLPSL